jgi:hypothetical protein
MSDKSEKEGGNWDRNVKKAQKDRQLSDKEDRERIKKSK